MLLFAHAGITLGLAAIAAGVQNRRIIHQEPPSETTRHLLHPDLPSHLTDQKKNWMDTLGNYGDIRLLILGSLIPDIIDKPVGLPLIGSGKIFCHSLLFLILISASGWCLWHFRKKNWLLLISGGTLVHLLLDRMWLWPRVFFWPLYGWTFPRGIFDDWLPNIWHALLTMPSVYIPELTGAIIILYFAIILIHRKRVSAFIRYGQIG